MHRLLLPLLLAAACGSPAGDAAALQRAVAAAVASGAPSFTVPPGVYNFSALPAGAAPTLAITNASDFTLASGGEVEFVFPPLGGLRVAHSARVALAGPFRVDAWPPFTTQGVVRGGTRDGVWFNFTLQLEPGYELDPARFIDNAAGGSRAIFFDPATRRFLPGQSLCVTAARGAKRHRTGRCSASEKYDPKANVL